LGRRSPLLRILVVNWQDRLNPQSGGAETHLHEVFGRLAAWGHEVTLLASGFPGAPARERVDGLDVHRVGGRFSFAVQAQRYFRKRLQAGPFDIIVEDLNKVPLFLPLLTKTPVVLLVHHLFGATAFQEASFPLAAATWLLERPIPRIYSPADTVAVSPSTALDLRERGLKGVPIKIVHNGVDLQRYSPDPKEGRFSEPTLLYLGRLKRYKRVDLVLRALARLNERGIDFSFLIAGKGDAEGKLRTLSTNLGLGERVRFMGYVDEEEKIRLLRKAWVHVLTSPKEGWGISALEAAACGTPTLASDSPGLRDVVVNGETGLLVPHADLEALAAGLQTLLEDPHLRKGMGEAARTFAEAYSWDDSARQMLDILETRVAARPSQT
jgi:glycosyltransferase involved in cell wall biosynthesis